MNNDPLYRGLLVNYLDGEPNSAEVLSDFLEDCGLERVENISRPAARLNTVIALMPARCRCQIARGVVASLIDQVRSSEARLTPVLDFTRRWLNFGLHESELDPIRKEAWELGELLTRGSLERLVVDAIYGEDTTALQRLFQKRRAQARSWRKELAQQRWLVRQWLAEQSSDGFDFLPDNPDSICEDGWRASFGETACYS